LLRPQRGQAELGAQLAQGRRGHPGRARAAALGRVRAGARLPGRRPRFRKHLSRGARRRARLRFFLLERATSMALPLRRLSTVILLAAAIGCPKPVAAPTAAIKGGDTVSGILVGQVVKLDGIDSKDPQSRDLTFDWSFALLP